MIQDGFSLIEPHARMLASFFAFSRFLFLVRCKTLCLQHRHCTYSRVKDHIVCHFLQHMCPGSRDAQDV